ncbi:hypothetical protein CAPTEDRAFT_227485 [Capitella teleta]|uniref:Uncharacterized protein n=1 Tax=Capitella teleta TaxID=283909 RepID=R7UZ79_CAPTE|nr:hypothetical protein CAPTEDRAFT_227485 [Capitella teleta]|eukprot:ELU11614.1 hypothetical protein CAPTEDRAFT_227485 [Capitella teleta]
MCTGKCQPSYYDRFTRNSSSQMTDMRRFYKRLAAIILVAMVIGVLLVAKYLHLRQPDESPLHSTDATGSKLFQKSDQRCARNLTQTMSDLPRRIDQWRNSKEQICKDLSKAFDAIFILQSETSPLQLNENMQEKMSEWLQGDKTSMADALNQTIILTTNRVTGQSNIFNALRAKRPAKHLTPNLTNGVVAQMEKRQASMPVATDDIQACDFCQNRYKTNTAEDQVGSMSNRHSYLVTNVFKLASWHSMVVLKDHDPFHWSVDAFGDALELSLAWFNSVHERDADFRFPVLYWDLLPKAGASIVHPHLHPIISRFGYHGNLGKWVENAVRYDGPRVDSFCNGCEKLGAYFGSLVKIHEALGLLLKHGAESPAWGLPSITPIRDNEVLVMAEELNSSFIKLLFSVIQAYRARGLYAFSMAVVFPDMDPDNDVTPPIFARIVSRGNYQELRSDVTSLELFAASNVNIDPYAIQARIKRCLRGSCS